MLGLKLVKNERLIAAMQKESFIIDQWKILFENCRVSETPALKRAIKRMQISPEGQSGCERSNSKYARFKTKYSNRMGLEIVRARSRAGENGPPVTKFPSKKALTYWVENNHKLALKVAVNDESLVLKRRRKEKLNYTSKLFL